MQKKFYSIFIFLSITICMTFAGIKVNAMENQTISKDLTVVGEDISKVGNDILNNMKSLKDLSSNEKNMLIINFQADFQTAVEFENKGYSAAEAIKLSSIGYKHGLNIEQVEKLLKNYSSIEEFANDMTKMKHYFKFEKISKEYTNEIKMLLYEGYSVDELNSAYRISKALNLKIDKIIKKDKSNNYFQRLDEELKNIREDEVKIIKQLDKNYFVDMIEVLKYCKSKKISIDDLSKKIITYESERNKLYGENTTQTLTASNASGTQKVDYSKYFNAPFVYGGEKNESISINNGSLGYNSIDYVLQGKNGLNLEIASCYNSSNAGLYEEGGYSEPYVFPEYQSKYAAIIKKTVFSIKSATDVTLVSETEINNGLFWIEQEATNANNNFISTHPNISVKQADGTTLVTSYTPIVCPVIVTVLVPSTRIVSTVGPTTYEESHAQMGAGWSWGFSSIQIDENDQKYLHLGSGQVYKVEWTPSTDDSNLAKYTLKDLRFENDTSFSNGVMYSSYVLFYKNGNKEYFGQDGRLLGIVDKYNNKITFLHTVEGFSGVHSIAKIIDSVGRVVTITYNFTAQTREIVLTLPDSNTIKYILEPLAGYNGEYVLKKKIDQMGRETVFDYQAREAKFNLASKDINYGAANFYANLISVTYPTKAQSIFSYEKVTGNMNLDGAMEYFRVVSKKNIVNGVDSNIKGYSYEGNHTGFPSLNNPENLQDTYTYKTSIADGKTVTINTFNNKHLLISQQIKDIAGNLLREVKYEYDSNKLPIKENTTLYSEGGKLIQKENSTVYNEFGDKTSFKNELGGETIIDYDLKYHLPKLTYNIADYVITNKVEYNIDAATGNIMSIKKHHFENGIDKSILTNYEYDTFGNIIKEKLTQNDGKIVEKNFEYSSDYNNAYLTKISTVVNDYINNVPQTIIESFGYDFNTGNKTSHIDGKGMQYTYQYDKLGRLIKETNPDLTAKTIVYRESLSSINNLLTNPSFETYTGSNGLADGWTYWVSPDLDVNFSIDKSIKVDGQNSQRINVTAARENAIACVYQSLSVKEGETYTITARASHNPESPGSFVINYYTSEWQFVNSDITSLSADINVVNNIKVTIPMGVSYITVCPAITVNKGQTGYLLVDNVTAYKVDNLLTNPSFETYTGSNGLADGWTYWVSPDLDANFSIEKSIKVDGQNSQRINVTAARESAIACVYQSLSVKEGETYTITARASHNPESPGSLVINYYTSEWQFVNSDITSLSADINVVNNIKATIPSGVSYITVCPAITVNKGQTGYLVVDKVVVNREQDDINNNSTILTNENNFSIRQQYDGLGRVTKKEEQNTAGGWTTLEETHYNTYGEVDWIKDALEKITYYQYDVLGRLISTTFPDTSTIQTCYQDGENKKIIYNEEGHGQYFVYDNSGNLIVEGMNRTDENNVLRYFGKVYQNDKFGKIISITDLNYKKILDYSYDDLGRMTSVTNAIGETTSYEYNSQDNIIKQTTAGGSTTTKYYDELGRLYQETDPLGKSEYISYDLAGNVLYKKDRNNTLFTYSYDKLNRLNTVSNTKGTIPSEFTYDSTGRTLSAKNPQGITTYEYYPNGAMKKEISPDGKFIYYEYYLDGTRSKMIDHFGKETTYGYDLRGRLKTVTVDSKTTTYEYYNDGSRKSITYPEGVKEEYFYNEVNNLIRLVNKKVDGSIISDFTYTYDDNGNQTSKNENGEVTLFTYDSLNRIKTVSKSNGSMIAYDYDSNSNVIKESSIDLDRNIVSSKNFVYDDNAYRLLKTEIKPISFNSLSVIASKASIGPDEQITFSLAGNINTTDSFLNEVLNGTTWSTNSAKIVLHSVNGKSITGSIPKASWDQMLADETIVVRATLLNKIYEVSIMKNNATLSSISITPTSIALAGGEYKTFTLSGKMSDGSNASDTFLNDAVWTVSSTKLTLNTSKGKSTTGVVSQAIWDQMLSSETITLRASVLGKTVEAIISKKYIPPVTLSSLSIFPTTVNFDAGAQKSFFLSGTMSDGTEAPDTVLNQAVWTVSSTKLSLNTTTGKTVIGTISQANWDQMSYEEKITLRAIVNDKVITASIYKLHPLASQLRSLSITPSSTTMYAGQSKTFIISGVMIDGSVAPESLLNTARWSMSQIGYKYFTLVNYIGKNNTVWCNNGTSTQFIIGNTESIKNNNISQSITIGGIFAENNLFVTIGRVSVGASITKRYSGGMMESQYSLGTNNNQSKIDIQQDVTTTSSLIINENIDEMVMTENAPLKDEIGLDTAAQNTLLVSTLATDLISTSSSYSYDSNGNLISIKDGNEAIIASYEYNEFNQLVKLANQSGLTSYTYNPSGLRNSKTLGDNKTSYYYDGDNVIIETINGNFTARNIMGINPIARETNTSKLYYLYNGHADVVAMVDATGTVINSYSYDIYGNIISANETGEANPIRYAGQYYDNESDMYYLRARYYDPGLMRFITEDSYKGDVKDPVSLNLYSYCVGNPIIFLDIDGHAPKTLPGGDDTGITSPSSSGGVDPFSLADGLIRVIRTMRNARRVYKVVHTLDKISNMINESGIKVYSDYAVKATKNADSDMVLLGKFMQDNVSYVDIAKREGATYFQLDNWDDVVKNVGEKNVWKINEQFLNQQWKAGKDFYFSHNPWEATGYFEKEVLHLIDLGVKDFVQVGNGMWKAIK